MILTTLLFDCIQTDIWAGYVCLPSDSGVPVSHVDFASFNYSRFLAGSDRVVLDQHPVSSVMVS
jgi:hypothetical protein